MNTLQYSFQLNTNYPNRSLTPVVAHFLGSNSYRYGFNGMEKDDEVKGSGNSYDFGARIYDSRLGRWLSIDPLQAKYPDLSPYNFVANSPLIFVDIDGREIILSGNFQKDPHSMENLSTILSTKKGYRQMAKFAAPGQVITINGKEFKFSEKGGKYHNKGINLNIVTFSEIKNVIAKNGKAACASADGLTTIVGKSIFVAAGGSSRESKMKHLTHEIFIHGTMYGEDLYKDGKKDYDNVDDELKKDNAEIHYHHVVMWQRDLYNINDKPEGNYIEIGIEIMNKYYNEHPDEKKGRTENEVKDELRIGVSIFVNPTPKK